MGNTWYKEEDKFDEKRVERIDADYDGYLDAMVAEMIEEMELRK